MSGLVQHSNAESAARLADHSSVVHRMRWLAEQRPDATALKFLPQGTAVDAELSYAELDAAARR
jgi:hypothetical protein